MLIGQRGVQAIGLCKRRAFFTHDHMAGTGDFQRMHQRLASHMGVDEGHDRTQFGNAEPGEENAARFSMAMATHIALFHALLMQHTPLGSRA